MSVLRPDYIFGSALINAAVGTFAYRDSGIESLLRTGVGVYELTCQPFAAEEVQIRTTPVLESHNAIAVIPEILGAPAGDGVDPTILIVRTSSFGAAFDIDFFVEINKLNTRVEGEDFVPSPPPPPGPPIIPGSINVRENGVDVGTRPNLNFDDTAQIDFAVSEDVGNNEIDISATILSIDGVPGELTDPQKSIYRENDVLIGTQPALNFIDGATIDFTLNNDPGSEEVEVKAAVVSIDGVPGEGSDPQLTLYRENDVDKSTQPAANFIDTATVAWSVTNDGPNSEAEIRATVIALPGDIGYTLPFGANLLVAMRYTQAHGDSLASSQLSLDQNSQITVPRAATMKVLSWNTLSADVTTLMKILKNGLVVEAHYLTGVKGTIALTTPIVAGDELAILYDSGTKPGSGTYEIYVE